MKVKIPTMTCLLLVVVLSTTFKATAQDFKLQHLQDDIGATGGTNTSFTPITSLNNAVAIATNNRKTHAGPDANSNAKEGHDMAGARVLTNTSTLTYYRESTSTAENNRFNTSIWEYTGVSGGANEMIVRGRYEIDLNGGTYMVNQPISGITNKDKCIPFITGIMNNAAIDDADSGTAIAYLNSATNLVVEKGGTATPHVKVYITLVEFTGYNWTVLHGDSGAVANASGSIALHADADGSTGATANVSAWNNAIIFGHHRGDTAPAGTNDSHADNWPTLTPGGDTASVQWNFFSTHDSDGSNRHFVHVLNNSEISVSRYTDTGFDKSIQVNITSAGLTDLNQALILGSTYHSGTGAGYGRGWKNYSFNSLTEVEVWTHRAGSGTSTISTELQVVNFVPPIKGPAAITANINLWLKADKGPEATNGTPAENTNTVLNWLDSSGNGRHALQNTGTARPIYTENGLNFNPTIDFDGSNHDMATTIPSNGTMSIFVVGEGTYPGTTRNILNLNGGGFGAVTLEQTATTTAQGRYFNGSTPSGIVSTTIAENTPFLLNYDFVANANAELFNAGESQGNATTALNTLPSSITAGIGSHPTNPSRRWDGGIAEVLIYNGAITSDERNQIESYLAIKYGMTLGTNGTSQDYVDSDNRIIWNQALHTGHNFNVTGIGRDDASDLDQKQSRNSATTDAITIGLKTIASTNSSNTKTFFADKTFLMWGHNDGALTAGTDITKDFGAGTGVATSVTATPISRTWKIVVTDSVPTVKVAIPEAMVAAANAGGETYIMIVADDAAFTTNVTSATMEPSGTDLEVDFYFEGTKYITFGATQESATLARSLAFDGTDAYLTAGNVNDLANTDFTISAWVKRNPGTDTFDIISKRNYFNQNSPTDPDGFYTHGYAFRINSNGQFRMVWRDPDDSSNNVLQTSATIPENEWHHIAASYDALSNTTRLFIDGFEEDIDTTLNPMTTASDAHFLIGAAHHINRQQRTQGSVDEVRVWNTALSANQIRYIMNQEIENNSNFVNGKVLPSTTTRNEINSIPWSNLLAYYPMSNLVFGSIKDASSNGNDASMINYNNLDAQTAPIPYQTAQNGSWDDPNTWLNGTVQYLPGVVSYLDALETIDCNIAVINHEVTLDNANTALIPTSKEDNRTLLSITVNSGGKLSIAGDNATHTGYALTVSHHLKLDGVLDLEGESQLLQDTNSDLDVTSTGTLQKDQQGTKDLYTYNYWSSPVSVVNGASNNTPYRLNDNILKNGTISATPNNITFVSNSFNGSVSNNDISIANYWIWKFTNAIGNDFSSWVQVKSSSLINVGEGFSMKGVADTGGVPTDTQNYVFEGKPNNGTISLPLSAGNDYLIGNPYPSAIDANAFILDNISDGGGRAASNIIDGTLYFWDHFGGGSHQLSSYEGGYATYTLAGGIVAISNDVRINATGLSGSKTPGRYIPVGQGFFVIADAGGHVSFNNSQRAFQKEGGATSVFAKGISNLKTLNSASDERQKIKLMLDAPGGYYRQILISEDANASTGFDLGYDARLIEDNLEDMYWVTENDNLVIQAIDRFNSDQKLALGVKINTAGIAVIKIDTLEQVAPHLELFLHDKTTGIYHDLRAENFEVFLEKGTYNARFELVFEHSEPLSTNTSTLETLEVHYVNDNRSIMVHNPNGLEVHAIKIYNNVGQLMTHTANTTTQKRITNRIPKMSAGIYIVSVTTNHGQLSKKIVMN